jgi:hypothetical protein
MLLRKGFTGLEFELIERLLASRVLAQLAEARIDAR